MTWPGQTWLQFLTTRLVFLIGWTVLPVETTVLSKALHAVATSDAKCTPLPCRNPPLPLCRVVFFVGGETCVCSCGPHRRDGRHLSVYGGAQLVGGVSAVAAVGVKWMLLQHGFHKTLEHFRCE